MCLSVSLWRSIRLRRCRYAEEEAITEQDDVQLTGGLVSRNPLSSGPSCGLDVPVAPVALGQPHSASCRSVARCLEREDACLQPFWMLTWGPLLVLSRAGLQLVLSFLKVTSVGTFPFLSSWACLLPLAQWFSKCDPWTSASDRPVLKSHLRHAVCIFEDGAQKPVF